MLKKTLLNYQFYFTAFECSKESLRCYQAITLNKESEIFPLLLWKTISYEPLDQFNVITLHTDLNFVS